MKVRFSCEEEWLAELDEDRAQLGIHENIVRVVLLYRNTGTLPFRDVHLIAAYRAHGEIIELDELCGQVMAGHPGPDDGNAKASKRLEQIKAAIKKRRLTLRGGYWHAQE